MLPLIQSLSGRTLVWPSFLNPKASTILAWFLLKPIELLRVINHVEERLGRCRAQETRWGERTLDIDILFYDDLIFENEILTIPHKELQNRAFVLVPMLEIAENYTHPAFKKTISELYDDLENPEEIFLYGTIKGDRWKVLQ